MWYRSHKCVYTLSGLGHSFKFGWTHMAVLFFSTLNAYYIKNWEHRPTSDGSLNSGVTHERSGNNFWG